MARKRNSIGDNKVGAFMIAPSLILIALVSIYPFINGIWLSLQNYSIIRNNERKIVWFKNFAKIITSDKEFYSVLGYTFVYTISVVAVSYIFGLVLAMLLNRNIKFRGVFRALVLIPWVIPPVVACISWSWVLNDHFGIINTFLENIGLINEPIVFLGKKEMARITVIFTSAWKSFPFMMVVILAGLQSIPKELYEAAYIDGAGFFKSFRHITLPLLKSVSIIAITLMFIWTFNNFENVYLLTRGGPAQATQVLTILTYNTAFYRGNISYASAISSLMMVVLVIISVIYLKVNRAANPYEL